MRKLEREPLSPEAQELLRQRTAQILSAGDMCETVVERGEAQKKEAERLWSSEKTKAFHDLKATLRRMALGGQYCMYCEGSEGSDVDHFRPKSKYPGRTYVWENHLWACSVCNSNYKRSEFPVDEHGDPLLINPVEEDPSEHLAFSPQDGKYVPLTPKGEESIRVFGLGRSWLETRRRDAWRTVQLHVIAYASACRRGNMEWALEMQRTLCRLPHVSLLIELLQMIKQPGLDHLVTPIDPDCLAALEECPEILSWP